MLKRLRRQLICWFKGHDWTCDAERGIALSDRQMQLMRYGAAKIVYNEQTAVYCKKCKHVPKPTIYYDELDIV